MKVAIYLSIVVAASAAVQRLSRATNEISVESICGELGVMRFNANELPDHVSPNDVRMCAKHPSGRNRTLDLSEGACYFKAPYGCSRGWCWKACDEGGKWCWTAAESGYGPWRKCASYADCGTHDDTFGCGRWCGKQCGCSC
ncbi:hypothetical protein TRIATDRAFT_219909 [Trichoderma atroviride IMI 206040]|uniref:IDI-2 n=1 Tax=Hypocrea atroviridis (strain ATCC 20476 / IMI 206040) TaxID=452589 RepID=G9NTD1_HYPAI|nr:uncharacterized protein TRIATDRAFT_219909 [Trichoderma atroviride IMI 206040]EHK45974.1 hypothetical protein TRIATDRAFT_219909 [Trichoderma atroviride IMI 206040]